MGTIFNRAESDVTSRLSRILKMHHPDLNKAEVTVDCVMAINEDGAAVVLHGYPCAAIVKIVSYKNRVLGRADAEITIDAKYWSDATDRQKDALLDHELTHLEIRINAKNQAMMRDRAGRPKLTMRLHDWQIGGFADVAQRFGKDAPETIVAREFKQKFGQLVFDFATKSAA